MAQRIDHTLARIPPPDKHLLASMAMHGSEVAWAHAMRDEPHSDWASWNEMGIAKQDDWIEIATTMYSVIALEGGATKKVIN